MRALGRYYELDVSAIGDPNPATGYLLNIKDIDRAAHAAIPIIAEACADTPQVDPAVLLPALVGALGAALPGARFESLRWRLTPYYSVEMTGDDTTRVLIRQAFDFAAAHRLHVASLSDEENRRIFGHCNNPAGHGHNYRIEPCVESELDAQGPAFSLPELERLTDEVILKRFDHAHLNVDTPEFGESGMMPSVENIARVFYELLAPDVSEASHGRATLRAVTVWETDRTSATYPG